MASDLAVRGNDAFAPALQHDLERDLKKTVWAAEQLVEAALYYGRAAAHRPLQAHLSPACPTIWSL